MVMIEAATPPAAADAANPDIGSEIISSFVLELELELARCDDLLLPNLAIMIISYSIYFALNLKILCRRGGGNFYRCALRGYPVPNMHNNLNLVT